MLMILGILAQAFIFLAICYVFYYITTFFFNAFRVILYYSTKGKVDWINYEEKIAFGILERNVTEAVVVPISSENKTHEQFWDDFNKDYDLQFKQDQFDTDTLHFRGRIKRRR